jgi:hypothetical protein
MRPSRLWLGWLSILVLLCFGLCLVSVALPDDVADAGYYDGDDDDAALAPERLAVLWDMALGTRAAVVPARTPEPFEGPVALVTPPIVELSPRPLLRSPPVV